MMRERELLWMTKRERVNVDDERERVIVDDERERESYCG